MLITVFEQILKMSLTGCYSIAVVGLVRLFLKQYGRKYAYLLWLVVFVNLCVPLYVEAPFSLIPQEISEFSLEEVAIENPKEQEDIWQQAIYEENDKVTYNGVTHSKVLQGQEIGASAELTAHSNKDNKLPENIVSAESNPARAFAQIDIKELCCALWLLGIVGLGLWNCIHMIRFQRKLAGAKKIFWDREQGILQVEGIGTPFLYGVIKPLIYLPMDLAEEERAYIIAHEKYHRKRRDYLVKPVVFGIVLLHWFNPLVWLAYFLFIRDMEFSCDEAVLADAEIGVRKQYAGSLLKCAARQNGYVLTMLTFGEPTIKSRIQNILHYKKRSVIVSGIVVLCVAAVSVGLLVRQEASEKNPTVESVGADVQQGTDGMDNVSKNVEADTSELTASWEVGELVPQYGRNIYVDKLLASDMVYTENAEEISYITFAKEGAEVAYVLAQVAQEGSNGSLWKVFGNGEVALLKQQISMGNEKPQYVTVDGTGYFVLNYWENERLYGKLLPFSEDKKELFPYLSMGKVIGEGGNIQCLAPSYRSCEAAFTETFNESVNWRWTAAGYLAYDFIYMEGGKIRELSAKEISAEELNALPYGADLQRQVAEQHANGRMQYILRENGRLDVNIFTKSENRAEFHYMSFLVQEEESNAVLQDYGEGVYLVSMTGKPALHAFLQALEGEEQQLPTDITQLPWGEEAAFTRAWENQDLGEREQSYIYGVEYELSETEQEIMQGLLLNCSENWDARPTYTEESTNADWNEANKKIVVLGNAEGFVAYSRYFESGMLIQTPDKKTVLIDGSFTSNYGVQPELLESDFDGDGSKELAIIGLTEHGTGVCVEYLYMVDKSNDGKWYAYRIKHDWYEEKLRAHIDTAKYSAGSQIDFYFEEGKMICKADLIIDSDTVFMGIADGSQLYMELGYLGDGKWTEVSCEPAVDEFVRMQYDEWQKQREKMEMLE